MAQTAGLKSYSIANSCRELHSTNQTFNFNSAKQLSKLMNRSISSEDKAHQLPSIQVGENPHSLSLAYGYGISMSKFCLADFKSCSYL